MLRPRADVEPVLADLRERDYAVTRLDGPDPPAAVAVGGSAPAAVTDRPLSVVALGEATPLRVVSRVADAAAEGRAPLLVADADAAAAARRLLADPFLLADETAGCRTFHTVADRIRLSDDTYAAVRADAPPEWAEEPASDAPEPRLVLEADGDVVAALRSVDALACPDPAAFPYRYTRGDDGRFRVLDRDGAVGRYPSVRAMRRNAYRPVASPLVPEHHVRTNPHIARAWTVATVDGDDVTYSTARVSTRRG